MRRKAKSPAPANRFPSVGIKLAFGSNLPLRCPVVVRFVIKPDRIRPCICNTEKSADDFLARVFINITRKPFERELWLHDARTKPPCYTGSGEQCGKEESQTEL